MNTMVILTGGSSDKLTVGQLIKKLEEFPEDMQVLTSCDEEGNSYYSGIDVENQNNLIVLYPSGSPMELDEAENFREDEDEA